ncbi:alkaline phosphatase D family protein [Parahaliea mediterranea]|uniref:alkaline phosphatase D family protein n=1 Tax=Parahaliea mediterranea TaxID=651086 RepID=UPI000E2ED4C0|nr:alkaline phosphatase D family protein [Parahaliea mediterranea]
MSLSRRELLTLLSTGTFLLSVGEVAAASQAAPSAALDFPQGVASGDPRSNSVMLWTRAVPRDGGAVCQVMLEVSEQADFAEPLLARPLSASADNDYTLRVFIDGLAPGRWYYYRFVGATDTRSRTGRTCTAPAPGLARPLNLAFVSCQNFEQAYFGAWARLIEDDLAAAADARIDAVLHLGDFIYERSWHTRQDGSPPSRVLPPFPNGERGEGNRYAVSLADYRHLYKTYLADPHLQEARARWPFIYTWDDHEFSDDNFQSYSHYGPEPVLEAQRKLDANRAWFEFIPCALDEFSDQPSHGLRRAQLGAGADSDNRLARDSLRIYRRLQWGSLVDMFITDERSYRSPPCLKEGTAESVGLPMNSVELVALADAGREYNNGQPPATLPWGDGSVPNPARDRAPGTCLGSEQRQWLLDGLGASKAPWKLWANPLPLLPLRLDLSSIPFAGYEDCVFNIDAWQGYPHEYRTVMEHLNSTGTAGVVSLSGDHHMHGAGAILTDPGDKNSPAVAVDFSCAGISSTPLYDSVRAIAGEDHPDFAALITAEQDGALQPNWNMTLLQGVLAAFAYHRLGSERLAQWLGSNPANPGLRFADSDANGYGIARFSATALAVELVAIEGARRPFTAAPAVRYRARFEVPLWRAGEQPVLQTPVFEGEPPFPFSLWTG